MYNLFTVFVVCGFMIGYFIQAKKISEKYTALAKKEDVDLREELRKDSTKFFFYVILGLITLGVLFFAKSNW